ncbi:MAG: UDP-glucose--hexose-1-phosphate uridylyltransferase [Acholeplasmataceae bacterium]|nr:UDP-glucose--hexose-1-phosphate uridylyltransferase [Acholeplasmataceae bacterium]
MINTLINELLNYGLQKNILAKENYSYTANVLIDFFGEKEFSKEEIAPRDIDAILDDMATYALTQGLLKNDDIVSIDNFKAKVVDFLIDKPQEVIRKFYAYYAEDSRCATDYLYELSKNTNYIQTKRIAQNIKWKHKTEYGIIDLTINLSKPEKDPRLIALQKMSQSGYPKCQLCKENEGYRGHIGYDARSNMRIIPMKLNNEEWFFQYSPYSYFNEHCIVLNKDHVPMIINRATFIKLLEFLDYFPEYFIGSNAGLPVVGGSILNHEHYQGGKYHFPIESAEAEYIATIEGVEVYRVVWPLTTIRIKSDDRNKIIDFAEKIFNAWQDYENRDLMIYNSKDDIHNTITPIARKDGKTYVFDLIFRNNYVTAEFPDGVFHPHANLHHIKKENIGLIEAMGLGVLPPRLKTEFALIARFLQGDNSVLHDEKLIKHQDWIEEIQPQYDGKQDVNTFILEEAGKVFSNVLKDAGVFKLDEAGIKAFLEFIHQAIK